ncbi:MAG: hypothetical protein HQL86_08610 [Magnetococcales bacterium]|nr:hypothetical protein [Magnetococcales bacterium]
MEIPWSQWLPKTAQPGSFLPLSLHEAERLERAFRTLLNGTDNPTTWSELGFQLERPAPELRLIHEKTNQGRGLYLLRPQQAGGVFIQAPHRFFDQLTGEITQRLFEHGRLSGAAWNTRHRHETRQSDLAHVEPSPFTAFARAIAAGHPQARIVQFHGFDGEKRALHGKNPADLIVSAGTAHPSESLRTLTHCLKQADLGTVRLYPVEVDDLGGTTNVTGRTLRVMGFSGFIHLETSLALRQRLLADPDALARLHACLTE